ncbi:MAG: sigma 54-interacting transcriptional regulator [Spirochaetota bacterium]
MNASDASSFGALDGFPTLGFYSLDEQLTIRSWNDAMVLLTGIARDDAVGRSYRILRYFVSPSAESEVDLADCMKENEPGTKSFYLMIREGDLCPVMLHSDAVAGRRRIMVLDIRDVNVCTSVKTAVADAPSSYSGIYGKAPAMHAVFRQISLAAESMANVLITGESGTGKELAARAIHDRSPRRTTPFVAVSCASLAESVLESELFGHVHGAFTGAIRDKKGKFELAHGGTIFLDEIGEISPATQVKLLRVIQERMIERVGGTDSIPVDMRIIAATNRDLPAYVTQRNFREDLFYRLAVFPIHMPPLRTRMNDIPLLCDAFIKKHAARSGKNIQGCTPRAMRVLMAHTWPGNVRELENTIEYAFVVAAGASIDALDLPPSISAAEHTPEQKPREAKRSLVSKDDIVRILAAHGGNRSAAAREIGISRVALWQKMKKLGLS